MSYDDIRIKVGRRPITVVELDLDYCANTYGTAPCTAAVGVTGAQKCFNTFSNCQDTANYVKGTKTYRFTSQSSFLPIGDTVYPCITSIDLAPVQIDTKGFSVSGSLTIELQDFPHHDRGVDKYSDSRSYDPAKQGTFFGKLRGRNIYAENRVIRVKEGYIDADRTIYSRTLTYFVDRIEGPDANGRVRIFGKDALRFADADNAKAPAVSKGSLIADIDANVATLTLVPTGVGADYPTSGTIRIDDELISYTWRDGDTLTGLTRGSDATVRDAHGAGTKVQLCIRYESMSLPQIMNDLLVNYAALDSQYVPLADWEAEAATWLGAFIPSVILSDPTGVKDLLKEIIESAGFAMWWDDISAEIRFKAIVVPLPSQPPRKLNENEHFLAGSISVKELPDERLSQVITYFLPTGATVDLKAENFRVVSLQVDTTGEGVNAYGTSNARTLLSRWVPSLPVADEVGLRLLKRYKVTPHQVTFQLDAKDIDIQTGDLIDISSRLIQDVDGTPRLIRCMITESRPTSTGSQYEYIALEVADTLGAARLIAPDGTPVWTSATTEQKNSYIFISNDAGFMSDGAPGTTIT